MPAATSWTGIITSDANSNYTTTVYRNGSLSGGTSRALPTGETGASGAGILPVLQRCRRIVLNLRSAGTITSATTVGLKIAVSGDTWTGTVSSGAVSNSGGTAVTLPTAEQGSTTYFQTAWKRACRAILNDRSTNG